MFELLFARNSPFKGTKNQCKIKNIQLFLQIFNNKYLYFFGINRYNFHFSSEIIPFIPTFFSLVTESVETVPENFISSH